MSPFSQMSRLFITPVSVSKRLPLFCRSCHVISNRSVASLTHDNSALCLMSFTSSIRSPRISPSRSCRAWHHSLTDPPKLDLRDVWDGGWGGAGYNNYKWRLDIRAHIRVYANVMDPRILHYFFLVFQELNVSNCHQNS